MRTGAVAPPWGDSLLEGEPPPEQVPLWKGNKKGTARPLSMGRIGSHFALFPLAASGTVFEAEYPEAAFALQYQYQ